MDPYERSTLDMLCLTGEAGWARLSPPDPNVRTRLMGATPIALFLREHAELWRAVRETDATDRVDPLATLSAGARLVYETLGVRGASFLRELTGCALDRDALLSAVGELVADGLVASDGFGGLRTIVRASTGRRPVRNDAAHAGRWSLLGTRQPAVARDVAVDLQAWTLLRRYGVVFRRVLSRETSAVPWRELARVYRRLEARGEIRGGRFVSGMSGEQFALADAVEQLREVRRRPPDHQVIIISAADPLNLAGIITAGDRVRAVASTRLTYQDGVPVAATSHELVNRLRQVPPGTTIRSEIHQ
jgi:ATP-dependent Lhr-like helicase